VIDVCLAVPARLVETRDTTGLVDFGGVRREVSLLFVPEAAVGDYVLVHAGCAIERLDEAEAEETLRLFREIGALDEFGYTSSVGVAEPAPPEPAGTQAS
jgi:hydrogenase expression/formation protein HypC